MRSRCGLALFAVLLGGCSVRQSGIRTEVKPPTASPAVMETVADSSCDSACAPATPDRALLALFSERVSELKNRGGECASYASVLETSVRGGRVTVRPFMWRVGGRLVSGEARTDGAIVVARHIDSLNVGRRTVEDMMWTLEHEAAHVAFRIANGGDAVSDQANDLVKSCR